ncbi:benzoate-CoA ligase family protein [soil metagenome]
MRALGSNQAADPPRYNATTDLLERNLVAGRAERPYLVREGRTWTYEEVVEATDAAGSGLLGLGLDVGDRVLVATRDRVEFVFAFWGAIKAGLVPVPVASGLSAADVHFLLSDSEARGAVCDGPSASAVLPATRRSDVPCVLVGGGVSGEGALKWEEVCGRPASLWAAPTTEDDVALWLYTSGTTGLPKAAMHRHRHLRAAPSALSRQVIGMEPDDIVLSVSKMFFAYGLGNSVYLPAAACAAVVVDDAPVLPGRVEGLLNRARPTLLFGVPAFFDGLSRLEEARLPDSIRMVISAGEALEEDLFARFRDRFGLPLLDGLGSTEALHHVTSNRPDDVVPGSAGRPLGGYEARVLDRDQQEVAEGKPGELWVRGPTTFVGYWRRPELTARTYSGDWMRTGDLVRMIDGRLFCEGRLDDLVKLGGVWLAPGEIEEVLRTHPGVAEAAVVTSDDGSGVPVLVAFVRREPEWDGSDLPAELRRSCRRRLAAFKVPKSFEVVSELPRTPTGKLKRFVLREQPSTRP